MLTPAHVLRNLGGVARSSHLTRVGIARRRITMSLADGSIMRIRTGVFGLPDLDPAVEEAAAHGGALTCAAALRLHGLWVLEPGGAPHVWLGGHGRVHHGECACTSHFFTGATRLGVAPLVDALVHAHGCGGEELFFAALESALRQGKIGAVARGQIRSRLPADARWLVDFARTDADSGLESLLRLRLHLLGIHLDCQVAIVGVGRVDFVIAGRLILEADGRANHDGASLRHKDLRRDAAASAAGYETLRFDYALIVHDWPAVESAILSALVRLSARS